MIKEEIKLFYCYAREDRTLRDKLEIHLSGLKHLHLLSHWYDREIKPGEEWEKTIDTHLNASDIILLLVSPHFMASDYCYGREMRRALERHESGMCRVIPIILRPVDWENAPFSKLQVLPTDAVPITLWHNRDHAFHNVAKGIGDVVKDLVVYLKTQEDLKTEIDWLEEGKSYFKLKRFEDALKTFEKATSLNPNYAEIYYHKGAVLQNLKRFEEALAAFEQTIHLKPDFAEAYYDKGITLQNLKRFEEALKVFERAIYLKPDVAEAYYDKGIALQNLKRFEEALAAFEQAIHLKPDFAEAYHHKGAVLQNLKRFEEALAAFEQAIRLNPGYVEAYHHKGAVLGLLKRFEEALAAFEQAIRLNPNHADVYINMGIALDNLKRYKEAQQAYMKAHQIIRATHPDSHSWHGSQ